MTGSIFKVFGDKVHQNDGTHLDSGIVDNQQWQRRYRELTDLPQLYYDPFKGAVGKRIPNLCAKELKDIRERKSNSEKFLTMMICLMTRDRNVYQSTGTCAL